MGSDGEKEGNVLSIRKEGRGLVEVGSPGVFKQLQKGSEVLFWFFCFQS